MLTVSITSIGFVFPRVKSIFSDFLYRVIKYPTFIFAARPPDSNFEGIWDPNRRYFRRPPNEKIKITSHSISTIIGFVKN